jgi:hypothetical protein
MQGTHVPIRSLFVGNFYRFENKSLGVNNDEDRIIFRVILG